MFDIHVVVFLSSTVMKWVGQQVENTRIRKEEEEKRRAAELKQQREEEERRKAEEARLQAFKDKEEREKAEAAERKRQAEAKEKARLEKIVNRHIEKTVRESMSKIMDFIFNNGTNFTRKYSRF